MKIKFHPSSVGRLMADEPTASITPLQLQALNDLLSKVKLTEKQAEKRDELIAKRDAPPQLSAGAKTYVRDIVDSIEYKYTSDFYSKETDKGTICEQYSIDLLNRLTFNSYEKFPDGNYENDYLTSRGCDIKHGRVVRDIKSSWSKKTHPKSWKQAESKLYEWQLRAYMMLFDCDDAYLDFMLVDTPDELIGYEDPSLHCMDDLTDSQRWTSIHYKRDLTLEKKMIRNIKLAWDYADEYIQECKQKSNY